MYTCIYVYMYMFLLGCSRKYAKTNYINTCMCIPGSKKTFAVLSDHAGDKMFMTIYTKYAQHVRSIAKQKKIMFTKMGCYNSSGVLRRPYGYHS